MNATKSRKPVKPVSGSCWWAVQPTDTHPGILVIETDRTREAYAVLEHVDGLVLLGWNLKKADGTNYDIPADLSSCDCADATYQPNRPGGCKHRKALAAALKALA